MANQNSSSKVQTNPPCFDLTFFYIIMQSAEIILRLRSPAGLNRLTALTSDTFGELRLKVSKALSYPLSDFMMFTEDGKPLSIDDRYKLREIPMMKDGAIIEIRLLKTAKSAQQPPASGVNVNTIRDETKNSKCQHPPGGKCLNCLGDNKPAATGTTGGTATTTADPKATSTGKCNHGPGGKCFNCTAVDPKDKNALLEKTMCQHGPGGKCIHCIDKGFINDVAHVSFDHWLAERKLKCKAVHPPEVKCNNCLPPTSIRYKVDYTCKNHQPYPKAMCNKCMPPSITIRRQQYRHLDYVQFMNVKDISNFVKHWVDVKHTAEQRVAYLYGYYAEDPHYKGGIRGIVEALYEPAQKGSYNDFQFLHDPFLEKVDEVAESLSLERIGWMVTETNHDTFLSQHEVRTACRFQEEYTVRHSTGYPISNFFTVVMRTDKKDTGEIKPEVYMVSDQAEALEREGFFADSGSRKMMKIRQAKDKEKLPTFVRQGKSTEQFEPEFLLVNIGHGTSPDNRFSILKNADFPARSRKKVTQADLKAYMQKYKSKPAFIKYSDFNFLLYIAEEYDLETARTLGHAVLKEEKSTPIIDEMIENKAGL